MTFLLIMPRGSFLREAITSFLRTEIPSMEVITVEGAENLDDLSAETLATVDLILIHVGQSAADGCEVLECVDAVRARIASKPIVLLGDAADDEQFRIALDQGTSGYIPAGTPADIVKHVLPIIANGGVYAPPFVFGSLNGAKASLNGAAGSSMGMFKDPAHQVNATTPDATRADSVEAFTRREVEVLSLLGQGLPNKLIAHRLDLKEGTVKVHVRHVMKKLNVTSRTQAALFAQKYLPATSE